VRTLRRELPRQLSVIAARFPEAVAWLSARATSTSRPESRDVVEEAIRALRKSATALSETDRLSASLQASAPPPRDPARIVHGTRKRSKGRR
jgi:ferric-dicitrate binding protein FerR (iron transport regulator)